MLARQEGPKRINPEGRSGKSLVNRLIVDTKRRFRQTEAFANEDGRVRSYDIFDAAEDTLHFALRDTRRTPSEIFTALTTHTKVLPEVLADVTGRTWDDAKNTTSVFIIFEEITNRHPRFAHENERRDDYWMLEDLTI